ncbi:hypothetical protein ABZ532_06910 [Streptomyces sp. NPDC019396]|uniref:hypothetical protein n=1 Tax=Streptomyces sp. NPDC019396 TaxID=3154687 RepID=UPI0033EB4D0A
MARELPLRFLPLDAHVGALRERYGPVYTAATLPAGVYGLTEPVGTSGSATTSWHGPTYRRAPYVTCSR